jgi:CHAT domain-containing protein
MRELDDRDRLRVLHIGCHGYFRGDAPLESGVVLASEHGAEGDLLTAGEIFDLAIEADLVTLSACQSGVAERRAGDELIGLTRALMYAGAVSTIVSLWTVDDLSTALVMERFYAGFLGGLTKAQALREAQMSVRTTTLEEVVAYCGRRLAQVESTDADRTWELRRRRADARAAAGDLERAAAEYELLHSSEHSTSRPTGELERAIVIRPRPEGARTTVDYARCPFEHPYYWAPFGLHGDWR